MAAHDDAGAGCGVVLLQLIGKVPLGVRLVDHMLVHRFLGVHEHALEVTHLLLFEELLPVVFIIAEALVLDALDQREPLAAIDDFSRLLDVLLGIALEVAQPSTLGEDPLQRSPGQLGSILQVSQQIGQFDV